MRIEAVVFDWGGTLSVFEPLELLDLWRAAARHIDPSREDELCARLLEVEAASWTRTTTTQRATTLASLLAEATRALGSDVAEAVLEEAATHHLDAWTPHIRHDPEAVGVLRTLRAQGLRIGLLSNTHWPREFHERFLERDGLADLIDARVYTSDLEWVKPHPVAFRTVLDELGVSDPRAAVFVGDRPHDDIRGARNAGMYAVLRRNPHLDRAVGAIPDAEIETLPELLDILSVLNPV